MSTVISIEDVSKLYRLGEIGTGSLAHDVNRWWHKARGREDPYLRVGVSNDRTTKGDSDYVYAVKDVSFEVKQGEVLGIIGRNGAGKSTLLKILSRVTTPTSGQIKVKGRIASLLEVGTGFHPELTGRENVFLNGAILGMRKAEIRSKFDEIVDFSGCERYIDTPVKRYSSGMYVRLAFAVAAHLETEILIVDEVLAVGDAEFQEKCLGKMQNVSKNGKTVIFVSHNLNAVTLLCTKGIAMRNGELIYHGNVDQALQYYGAESIISDRIVFPAESSASKLKSLYITREGVPTKGFVEPDSEITFEFEVKTESAMPNPRIGISIVNSKKERIFSVATWLSLKSLARIQGHERVTATFRFPALLPGKYMLDVGLYDDETNVAEEYYSVGAIEMIETNYLDTTAPSSNNYGQIQVKSTWKIL